MKKFLTLTILLLMISSQVSATELKLNRDVDWSIGLGGNNFAMRIEGYSRLDGDFSKGVAIFGERLHFYFDALLIKEKMPQAKTFAEEEKIFAEASRFGGSDFENTVPVYTFEGMTKIYPISCDDGREFFLLMTETGGGGTMKVIGERDGKWTKYFDTMTDKKTYGVGWDYHIKNFYTDGDKIIFEYEHWKSKKISRLVYKWDEAAQWFDISVDE